VPAVRESFAGQERDTFVVGERSNEEAVYALLEWAAARHVDTELEALAVVDIAELASELRGLEVHKLHQSLHCELGEPVPEQSLAAAGNTLVVAQDTSVEASVIEFEA